MSNANNYNHFEEIVNIQEQYKAIRDTYQRAEEQKYHEQQLNEALLRIVKPEMKKYKPDISSISEIQTH